MSDFKIVGKKAKVDQCYGLEAFHITKEEIAALLAGKKLYSTVNCGEYAITIELGERVTIPKSKLEKNSKKLENPATKNDLGVDCISRADAIRVASGYCHPSNVVKELAKLPSVTPQEPQSFEWCTDCKEYDQEKHCCHRWSKVIRDTVEEMRQEPKSEWEHDHAILKAYSDGANEVLDKIRAEIDQYLEIEGFGSEYRNDVKGIIDKYKAESAHDAAQEIVKNNGVVDL